MSRIAYVNGRYCPHREAVVHIEDRGYQFADGVYEVCEVAGGRLIDAPRHLARLQRSLGELRIAAPVSFAALPVIMGETVRRNRVVDGIVYVQITRGVARRDFPFPAPQVRPTLVVTARRSEPAKIEALAAAGIAVVTVPDIRWGRVDIKSVALLPNVLAKQAAREQGAREAWLVDAGGKVTEGASSNAWIVSAEGRLVTRALDHHILRGITRTTLLDVARAHGLAVEERAFTPQEAYAAREAFVTSASQTVMSVVQIDGHRIGDGTPGPLARALRRDFHQTAHAGVQLFHK
ncbi:MAG TPA: D-amino-acid transaminase [Pseudolabrys sp.]|nr:D-amino-acid transaminase [Pseudolabrys sp.]